MPRLELRPDEVEHFRRRLTAAAAKLFARHGYEGVTMRKVAAACDVSAMTPYRYVENKDELFALVRADAFRRFADHLEAALAGRGGGMTQLRRLERGYVEFAQIDPDGYRVMFELAQQAQHAELAREAHRAFDCLHRTVRRAVDDGELTGDPLTLAHLLWASTHGLVSLHLAGKLTMGRSLEQLLKARSTP